MDWIYAAKEGQVVGCCEHGDEPSGSVKCNNIVTSLGPIFSSRTVLCGVS